MSALLSTTDTRVTDLRTAAAADLGPGLFSAAQARFEPAIALDEAARRSGKAVFLARTVSPAETLALSANASSAALDHAAVIAALMRATAPYAEAAPLGLPPAAPDARSHCIWKRRSASVCVCNPTDDCRLQMR